MTKKLLRACTMLGLTAVIGAGVDHHAAAKEPRINKEPPKDLNVFNQKDAQSLIDSLTTTSRQTSVSVSSQKRAISAVFKNRLGQIDQNCEVTISYQILKAAYAVKTDQPEALGALRYLAEGINQLTSNQLKGVSPRCRSELKGLSASILRVYLGSEWRSGDEQSGSSIKPRLKEGSKSSKTKGGQSPW